MDNKFEYERAFDRNIGWVTDTELQNLRDKRVAIAGMGGVGGWHLLNLVRLGIGRFNIADFDDFDLDNFNRQCGATMKYLGRPKVDVMAEMALDINPELDLKTFPEGVNAGNVDEFLKDVDIYIDGIDFFVMGDRETVFAACAEKGIPALTAAPLGWGVAFLAFLPRTATHEECLTFEEYFQMSGCTYHEKLARFLVGLSPSGLQLGPLVDASRFDLEKKIGPSTNVGANLCAAVTGTNTVKLLLGRGEVIAAPKSLHFDAFENACVIEERLGGMSHPQMQSRLAEVLAQSGAKP